MLKFSDFYHLPQLDPLINEMVASKTGLIVIAGIDARPEGGQAEGKPGDVFLASGLTALFDILVQTMLAADSATHAVVVARQRGLERVPRQLKRRIKLLPVELGLSYERQVRNALDEQPSFLVIDRLTSESAAAAFNAAEQSVKVIAGFDTALRGAGVTRQLLDLGIQPEQMASLRWVLSAQRLPALCPTCRRELDLQPRQWSARLAHLRRRYPELAALAEVEFFENGAEGDRPRPGVRFWRAAACGECHNTGRSGDVAVFDVFRAAQPENGAFDFDTLLSQGSDLSFEEYILRLAAEGFLDLDVLLWLETDQLRRAYNLLATSEQALTETSSTLTRKLFELEASNRVLLQRTEVLMSLEDLGQALIASEDLGALAKRVCRRAGDLCGADRVILYLLREIDGAQRAEVLAAGGWEGADVVKILPAYYVFGESAEFRRVSRFVQLPPGVTMRPQPGAAQSAGASNAPTLQSGLRVPLTAQDKPVGMMIVQSTQKGFFTPGESALLQTFANQAALAIQRAGLVDELRAKITELEAAQAELVKKGVMEHELEMARQVQQSLLPVDFAEVEGFQVAARNEPARQVGGDFYDMILLDEDHFGVVMADVSDKGMPAALYMGLSRSLIMAEAHRELSPCKALQSVNRLLLELGDLNGFVSVFYGVVEVSTRRMRYARAGHEKPWLLRDGRAMQLGGEGMVLGIMESANLTEEEVMLQSGDRLVLFTDGLSDATDAQGGFFGGERLQNLLLELAERTGEEICEGVFEALKKHKGESEQFDDMTLLVLEVR